MRTETRGNGRPRDTGLILDRQPPRSLEAEQCVLGSILMAPNVVDQLSGLLRAEDFYDEANRVLYERLVFMSESAKQVDAVLLVEELRRGGEYELVGGMSYIAKVSKAVPTSAHAVHYAEIVRDKAQARALIDAATEILREAYADGPVEPLAAMADASLFRALERRSSASVTPVSDVMQETLARLSVRGQDERKVSTHFLDVDRMLGGFRRSELIILAARPSMGKTALALNIAERVTVDHGGAVYFASLEMGRMEVGERLLISCARVSSGRIRQGTWSNQDQSRMSEASALISQAKLFIADDAQQSIGQIFATARLLKRREGINLIVVDYLQLIEPSNPRDPREQQVALISKRLKQMARELDVPVLCLAQLNRQTETSAGNRPRLSHLRESGAVEQDADMVLFVHREEYYATTQEQKDLLQGQAEIIVGKNRNGPTPTIPLTWLADVMRFEDTATKRHEAFAEYGDFS